MKDESEGFRLVIEGRKINECRKCDNYTGDCGTPCVDCEVGKKFSKEWDAILWLDKKFVVYKKKAEVSN